MTLRPYQVNAVNAVVTAARAGRDRQLVAMPDGVGRPVSSRVASAKQRAHLVKARAKRGTGFTPDGIRRLRAAAYRSRPWASSTGPRSELGKHRVARNALQGGGQCKTIEPWRSFAQLRPAASAERIGSDLLHLWEMLEMEPTTNGVVVIDRLFALALTLNRLHRYDLFIHVANFALVLQRRMVEAWVVAQDSESGQYRTLLR